MWRPKVVIKRRLVAAGGEQYPSGEERRRLKIISNAFGEKPVLKLMFGAMIRAAERWRAVKVAEFERRQMAARQDLDQEYEARTGFKAKSSSDRSQTKIFQHFADLT